MVARHSGESEWRFWQILVNSPNVCKLVQYASSLPNLANCLMKESRLSKCVKWALRNMWNVVGNFVTRTDGFYGRLRGWPSEFNMETRLDLQLLCYHRQWWRIFLKNCHPFNWGLSNTQQQYNGYRDHANVKTRLEHVMPCSNWLWRQIVPILLSIGV